MESESACGYWYLWYYSPVLSALHNSLPTPIRVGFFLQPPCRRNLSRFNCLLHYRFDLLLCSRWVRFEITAQPISNQL